MNHRFALQVLRTNRNNMACCLTCAVLLLSLSVVAHATASVDVQQVSGDAAIASFSSVDSSGCIVTDAFVFATTGEVHDPPGGPAKTEVAGVAVSQFDRCRGVLLFSGLGSTATFSFSFAADLSSASLNGAIPIAELLSGTTQTVQVAVTWIGTGDTARSATNTRLRVPGFVTVSHFNGAVRAATAAGTITIDEKNFTPAGSVDGLLEQSANGNITVLPN